MREELSAGVPVRAATLSRRDVLARLAGLGGMAAAGSLLAGCGGGSGGDGDSASATALASEGAQALDAEASATALPTPQALRTGLEYPWGLAFLPDRSLLVTERVGRLRRVSANGASISTVSGLPANIHVAGHGGLLDVAVEQRGSDTWVYLSYAERQGDYSGTAVARARLVGGSLSGLQVIFRALPKVPISTSVYHYGCRLVLAPNDKLFIALGERRVNSQRGLAQSLGAHHGKIVRINRDGSVPADNPFVGRAGAKPEIWSLGHRNPQGLVLHPGTGDLWESEHGPQGGDEVNVVLKGHNYGWPRISYGCEYGTPTDSCTVVGGATSAPGMDQPKSKWVPLSIAPSGLAFYNGAMFPEWKGNLFLGALAGTALWRLTLSGRSVTGRTKLYGGLRRRIRDVRQAPDGALLLLTDESNGRILRLAR